MISIGGRGVHFGAMAAVVAASLATAVGSGHAAPGRPIWTACALRRTLSGTQIAELQVARMSCTQAAGAIKRARVLLTPGGPIFSSAGQTCRATNLEPTTPAPSQLPELVRCRGHRQQAFRFIWTWV